jgi:uncharacterized iron-regulated membrane protein
MLPLASLIIVLVLFCSIIFGLSASGAYWKRGLTKNARNEQRKLAATALNGMAVAIFVIGLLTPFFIGELGSREPIRAAVVTAGAALVLGFAFHWVARHVIGQLEE